MKKTRSKKSRDTVPLVLAACTQSRFHCFLLVSRVQDISLGIRNCFPGGLCKFYANVGGKRQPLLVQYKQQANPPLSMNNYTPLVISRKNKNKQLSLLSQRKLALTARNIHFLHYKIIRAHKKCKKWPLSVFMTKTSHKCQQKTNPSRHTVPLKGIVHCQNVSE